MRNITIEFLTSLCLVCLAGRATSVSATRNPTEELLTLDLHQGAISGAAVEHFSATKKQKFISEYQQKHFWFYNFTIGTAKLKSFVDTGSFDVTVIRGYKPSKKSRDLNMTFRNTYATTRPNGSGHVIETGELYRDIVGVPESMLVPNQEISVVKKRISMPPKPVAAKAEAILGLGQDPLPIGTHGSTRGWFHSLCAEGLVRKCRFGLVFGINKKGKQLLGGVDPSLYHGKLTRTKKVIYEWSPFGDVVVNNKTVAKHNQLVTDSGTSTILGPSEEVRAIFKDLGVKIEEKETGIRGIYPCHKKLDFGFRFPGAGKDAKTFNVLPSAMAFQPIGDGNCYAALETVSTSNFKDYWVLGQAFMQGLYVDHDVTTQTMGFAHLKSKKV